MKRLALVLAFVFVIPLTVQAQTGSGRAELARAIAAYQNLDFDVAATTLRRALERELSTAERIEALSYLGAAEHYRARPDSAKAVFRRLIQLAPGFQLDTLVFPPEVTHAFDDVRSRTREEAAVQVAAADTLSQSPPVRVTPPPQSPPPAPNPRAAQRDTRISATGGGLVANMRAHSEGGLPNASGTVLGLGASARLGRFELGFKYLEGSLSTRDVVEGAVALRYVTTPWLALQSGPHIRRYDTSLGGGAERWVMWQIGARAETPISTKVRGHAMLWQGLGVSVNVASGSGSARGGEIGATYVTNGPFRFGIAYSIDHASAGSRSETVNALMLTAGVLTP